MENSNKNSQKNNKNKPTPIALAINICDSIIRDEVTKKVSLIGLFNTIRATTFPTLHPLFHVYVALTNGHGKYKTEIRIVNLNENKLVVSMEGELNFLNPLQVVEINIGLQNVQFEKPGKYGVQVFCENALINTRNFMVIGPSETILPTSGTEVK